MSLMPSKEVKWLLHVARSEAGGRASGLKTWVGSIQAICLFRCLFVYLFKKRGEW